MSEQKELSAMLDEIEREITRQLPLYTSGRKLVPRLFKALLELFEDYKHAISDLSPEVYEMFLRTVNLKLTAILNREEP